MTIRVFICLVLMNLYDSSFAENKPILINGNNYSYSISEKFIKLNDSITDAQELSGDITKSISLLIPANKFSADNKNDISVILFLDRNYGHSGELRQFAKDMLVESRRLEVSDKHIFIEKLRSRKIKYQSSFDPFSKAIELNEYDYFAQIIEPEVIDIPGVKTMSPKITCKVWFVKDGILFQAVAFEKWCSNREYDSLSKYLSSLLDEWRITY